MLFSIKHWGHLNKRCLLMQAAAQGCNPSQNGSCFEKRA